MARRAEYQTLRSDAGTVTFKKQWTNPITGKAESFSTPSETEMRARVEELKRARRLYKAGTVTALETLRIVGERVRPARTVREVWDRHVETLASSWAKQARSIFKCRFADLADCKTSELDAKTMGEWEKSQRAGDKEKGRGPVGAKTVQNAFDVLTAAIRRAIREDRTGLDLPWGGRAGFDVEREPRWIQKREACRTPEELRALLEAADKLQRQGEYRDLRFRVLWLVAFALRTNEGAASGWDDIERLPGGLQNFHIRHQCKGGWRAAARLAGMKDPRPLDRPKGEKVAALLMAPIVAEELERHREHLQALGMYRPNGPIFPGMRGDWRGLYLIRPATLRRIVELAGLPTQLGRVWVTHSLRATGATLELAARHGDLVSTAERTRHADLRALRPYLHPDERGLSGSRIALPEPALRALPPREGDEPEEDDDGRAAGRPVPKIDLLAMARTWLETRSEWRPREVTEEAERAYRRRYAQEKRAGTPAHARANAARRSKIAYLANWRRVVGEAARAVGVDVPEHGGRVA